MSDWFLYMFPPLIAFRMWQDGLSRWDSIALLGYSSIPLVFLGLDKVTGREEGLITVDHYAFMSAVFIAIGFLWGRRGRKAEAGKESSPASPKD